MPTLQLTKKNIDSISCYKGRQILYHDTDLSGFGLRVSSKTKTYFVQRAVNNRTVRTTIGKHGVFTPEQARKEAIGFLADMTKGVNPNKVKREKKTKLLTFIQAFDARIEVKSEKLRAQTILGYKNIVENYLSDWKNKALQDITKTMIMQRHAEITKNYGPCAATSAMRIFSVTYNYAKYLSESLHENPISVLSHTKSWHQIPRRQTVIKPYDLPTWYKAVLEEPNEIMRDCLLLLLFTGFRRSEATGLKWEDIDFDGLTIRLRQTKNGHDHVLPMGKFVKDLLLNRWENRVNSYVFPGTGFPGHIKDPKKAINRIRKVANIIFSPHDLRRTFTTIAESLDLSSYTIKYLINHRTNRDLTGGYMVLDINRMREPMKKIEAKILELISDGR